MPAQKKHASTRARRNKAATAATLQDQAPEDRGDWTVKALRAEIDARNSDGRPDDEKLSKGGSKADLAARLLEDDYSIPALPDRPYGWQQITRDWWRDVWSSPMSNEWHPESDYHNVLMAALHYDDMWTAQTAVDRQKASALFARLCEPLGLNPYARRRLEWTIETASEAKERGEKRRTSGVPAAQPPPKPGAVDPRAALSLVKKA